jgi:DNA-binding GntR family transcriptional regulator
VLEELAALLAVPRLTPVTLDQLRALLNDMREATARQDFARLLELNRAFHFALYQAAGRPILLQIISGLWDRSGAYRRVTTFLPRRALPALAEHEAIFALCATGDAPGAARAVRANVRKTTEVIRAKLDADDDSPP